MPDSEADLSLAQSLLQAGFVTQDDFLGSEPALEGERIGPYVLLEQLWARGNVEVHRALDETLQREVALKVVAACGPDWIARLRRSTRIWADLGELPGIVPLYSMHEIPRGFAIAMRYMSGGSLEGQRLEPRAAAVAVERIARAIHHGHVRGLIHRDIKPANVLLDASGAAALADFGLAREISADVCSVTASGTIVGTPQFMAPEQVMGAALSPRTDVYGLGATLYTLVSGTPPVAGANLLDVLHAVQAGEIPPLIRVAPEVPPLLSAIASRAVAKSPAERHATALELAEELADFLDAPVPRPRPPASRRARALGVGLVGLLAVGLVAGLLRKLPRAAAPASAAVLNASLPPAEARPVAALASSVGIGHHVEAALARLEPYRTPLRAPVRQRSAAQALVEARRHVSLGSGERALRAALQAYPEHEGEALLVMHQATLWALLQLRLTNAIKPGYHYLPPEEAEQVWVEQAQVLQGLSRSLVAECRRRVDLLPPGSRRLFDRSVSIPLNAEAKRFRLTYAIVREILRSKGGIHDKTRWKKGTAASERFLHESPAAPESHFLAAALLFMELKEEVVRASKRTDDETQTLTRRLLEQATRCRALQPRFEGLNLLEAEALFVSHPHYLKLASTTVTSAVARSKRAEACLTSVRATSHERQRRSFVLVRRAKLREIRGLVLSQADPAGSRAAFLEASADLRTCSEELDLHLVHWVKLLMRLDLLQEATEDLRLNGPRNLYERLRAYAKQAPAPR